MLPGAHTYGGGVGLAGVLGAARGSFAFRYGPVDLYGLAIDGDVSVLDGRCRSVSSGLFGDVSRSQRVGAVTPSLLAGPSMVGWYRDGRGQKYHLHRAAR